MAILDDTFSTGVFERTVELWRVAYKDDYRAFETWLRARKGRLGPPNIRLSQAAAYNGEGGHPGHGSVGQRAVQNASKGGRPPASGPGPATPPLPPGLTFTATGDSVRAGDRILHIFSSNGEHDWHESEVVAAPTTAAEKKRGFLYNVRYGANEMRAQGLRPEDYRKYWLRIAPHKLGRQIGAVDQVAVLSVPVSRRVALAGSDKAKWEEAIHDEYKAMEDNGTWIAVDERSVPPGAQVLPSSPCAHQEAKERFIRIERHGLQGAHRVPGKFGTQERRGYFLAHRWHAVLVPVLQHLGAARHDDLAV